MFARVARLPSSRALAFSTIAASSLYLYSAHSTTIAACDADAKSPALSPQAFKAFPVRHIESISPNTKRITLALPHKDDELGMTPASMILVRATIDGKPVVRPYTPTNPPNDHGELELVVKAYPNGTMSKHLCELQIGDPVDVKGPMVKFQYVPNKYKHIGMIAGGTGITPMLQLIRAICLNPDDKTEVTLLCANVTEQDMLLKGELDKLQATYPQLRVRHVLSAPSESWKGLSGFVSTRTVFEFMPGSEVADCLICVCGPPGMMQHVSGEKAPDYSQGELKGVLFALGYTAEQVFKF